MNSGLLYILLLIALLYAIGESIAHPRSDRVLGGEEAAIGQFGYVASVRFKGAHICGGSIISNRYILTAAHCVAIDNLEHNNVDDLTVRVGSNNQFAGGKILQVEKIHIHPQFSGQQRDIAVVRLSENLVWNERIQSIDLVSNATAELSVDDAVTVAGWGSSLDASTSAYYLRYQLFKVASENDCLDAFPEQDKSFLCLKHELHKGSCTGDAGNGAVHKNKLIAVTNFVVGACGSRYPDVFAKVAYYLEWIQSII